ncbi:rac GTPase-activating protein 1 [Anopheles bellator]|uniref:rac GTPase-activating protein 1 n=1 Tax=Anopheles bellator TaxID=139047 RepID=UPI0026486497|nr:rac GTPase-activating protein 1 [Anopheles bellator]
MELSLVAQFDELRRSCDVLRDGAAEIEFLRFVQLQDECRTQWLKLTEETQRLQREQDNALRSISNLESKLFHARKLLETESKARRLAEKECDTMEHKMMAVFDIVRNEQTLRDETRVRLAQYAAEPSRKSRHGHSHLDREMENNFNSSGSFMCDLSLTQSEDDLLEPLKVQAKRKTWKKHRPSYTNNNNSFKSPQPPEVKRVEINSAATTKDYGRVGVEGEIIAHAKVSVPTGIDGGPILAESTFRTTAPQQQQQHLAVPLSSCPSPSSTAATVINVAPTVDLKQTPTKAIIQRQHDLCGKTFLTSDTCNQCQERIRFGSNGLRCRGCKANFHSYCRDKISFPCAPQQAKGSARRGTVAATAAGATPQAPGALSLLEDYCPSSSPRIPALIVHCVSEIENRGLAEVGLYRMSGAERDVRTLKEKFLRGKSIPALGQLDIHVLCGCIKDFLRTLREPLIPASLLPEFSRIVANNPSPNKERVREQMCQIIERMPTANRDTLAFLMLHFQRVAQSAATMMPVDNLSRVFGPTICGYSRPDLGMQDTFAETIVQFSIVQTMLSIATDYWSQFITLQTGSNTDVENIPPAPNTQRNVGQQPSMVDKARYQETPILRRPRKDRKYYATPPYRTSKEN